MKHLSNFLSSFFDYKPSFGFARKLLHILIYVLLTAYVFSIPTFSYRSGYYLISWAIAIGLTLSIVLYCIFFEKIIIDRNILLLIFFNILILFSTLLNGFENFSTQIPLSSAICILLFQFFNVSQKKEKPLQFIYLGFICFAAVFFISNARQIFSFSTKRLGDEFGNQNSIGTIFSLLSVLGFYYFFKNPKHFYHVIFGLIGLYFSLLTGSRGGLLVIVISLSIIIVFTFGKKKWYISLIIILSAIILLIFILSLKQFSVLRDRIFSLLILDSEDEALAGRSIRICEAFELFYEKPLFGWGINGFANNTIWHAYSHNTFSETLANFGLIGTIIFFIMFLMPYKKFVQLISKEHRDYIGFLLLSALLVGFISTVFYSQKEKYVILALIFSIDSKQPLNDLQEEKHKKTFVVIDLQILLIYINFSKFQKLMQKKIPFLYKTIK